MSERVEIDALDVYPVGLLMDWKHRKVRPLRRALRYPLRQARAHNWRAVRNYFNGYLAEHDGHPHNAGRGWTKRAAVRRVNRICPTHPPRRRTRPRRQRNGG